MQINFTRGEKKLLKDLKIEYFHLIMMKHIKNKLDMKKKKKTFETKMVLLIIESLIT